eukprot:TRINITY_DN73836_c0_g1_i1.p1 TRINITY_DN73836_c0_g1~~TRINITY_DN73836_c0_g1_i1.p1  ORF type:complete len:372 (+),score=100.20 TRINITY_DN73836_c0_g1_i1:135-1118(+)
MHPNIDKASWIRYKHREQADKDEDEDKKRARLGTQLEKLNKELRVFGEAGKEHTKAKKLQKEIDGIEAELAEMDKNRKWNANSMCKTAETKTVVSEPVDTPAPEPRLQGEAVAAGYCEFVEDHEELLEKYIDLGAEEDLEKVQNFLREHGSVLLQGEHAESYLLLDCLEKEMNGFHQEMRQSCRQFQFISQLREFSRASGRPARDSVNPIFKRIMDSEVTFEAFEDTVNQFASRIEKRAVVKKKEMDEEMAREGQVNPEGPGGLSPMEVFETLPKEMQEAFRTKDAQRLQRAVESLSDEDAKYHLRRCEDSGLWVPSKEAGPPPYRQ